MEKYNKIRESDKWILRNLRNYGNCICDKQRKEYGESNLLELLKEEGFNCRVTRIDHEEDSSKKKSERYTYILEVIKK